MGSYYEWAASLAMVGLLALAPGCPGDDDADDDVADDDVADDDATGDDDATEDDDATGDDDDDTTDVQPIHVEEQPGCDDVNPLYCGFPFPSDRYLAADGGTVTGYRLDYPVEFLPGEIGNPDVLIDAVTRLDGMSPATQIMTLFDRPADISLSGVATVDDIGRSLEPDSPTVIVDLQTGEWIPHWVENDARALSDGETVLYLRLASHLAEDHGYVVGLRGLVDAGGAELEMTEPFLALRDDIPTDSDLLEDRRAGFEAAFDALAAAGVDRATLQQAWWFHTASGETIRGDMLHIRADALTRLGPDGIGCSVTSVEDGYGGDGLTYRRVRGTYTVPSYVDSPAPPTRFVRGADGLPQYVDDYEIPFTAILPASLAGADGGPRPGPLLTFGHGLLGSGEGSVSGGNVRDIADRAEVVMLATDWDGMSSEDVPTVGLALADPTNFVYITERLQQGIVNQIALTRTFAGVCGDLPEFEADGVGLLDPTRLQFVGGSQGGIFGGTLMTLSPDIDRGVLLVNGVVFPTMMERSIDYAPFFPLFELAWPDRLDQALLLPLAQHLWDSSEPSGYLPHLADGLPGIGPHEVLSVAAVNDAQVPNVSTDQAMRMVGAAVIEGSALEPWGMPLEQAPFAGNALVYIDMGDRPVPAGNLFPEEDDGGHGAVGTTDIALAMMQPFLETGVVPMPCEGICDPD